MKNKLLRMAAFLVVSASPLITLPPLHGAEPVNPDASRELQAQVNQALTSFLEGKGEESLTQAQAAIESAARHQDRLTEASARRIASLAFGRLGEWPQAIEQAALEFKLWDALENGPRALEARLRHAWLHQRVDARAVRGLINESIRRAAGETRQRLEAAALLNAAAISAFESARGLLAKTLLRSAQDLVGTGETHSAESVAILHNLAAFNAYSFVSTPETRRLLDQAEGAAAQIGPAAELGMISLQYRRYELADLLEDMPGATAAGLSFSNRLSQIAFEVLGVIENPGDWWLMAVPRRDRRAGPLASFVLQPFDDDAAELAEPNRQRGTTGDSGVDGILDTLNTRRPLELTYGKFVAAIAQLEGWTALGRRRQGGRPSLAQIPWPLNGQTPPAQHEKFEQYQRAQRMKSLLPDLPGQTWPSPLTSIRRPHSERDTGSPAATAPPPASTTPSARDEDPGVALPPTRKPRSSWGRLPIPGLEQIKEAVGSGRPKPKPETAVPVQAREAVPGSNGRPDGTGDILEAMQSFDPSAMERDVMGRNIAENWEENRQRLFRGEIFDLGGMGRAPSNKASAARRQAEARKREMLPTLPAGLRGTVGEMGGRAMLPSAIEYLIAANRGDRAVELLEDIRAIERAQARSEAARLRDGPASQTYPEARYEMMRAEEAYFAGLKSGSNSAALSAALKAAWQKEEQAWRDVLTEPGDLSFPLRSFDAICRALPADAAVAFFDDARGTAPQKRSSRGVLTLIAPAEGSQPRSIQFFPMRMPELAIRGFQEMVTGEMDGVDPSGPSLELAGQLVYRRLFPEAARQTLKKAGRLVICPSRRFWDIPFAALNQGTVEAPQYLGIEKSLTLAPFLGSPPGPTFQEPAPSEVLVMGGAVYESRPGSAYELLRRESLPNLSGARGEANAIAQIYGVAPLVGAAATEGSFRSRAPTARLIHLGSHGLYQDDRNSIASAMMSIFRGEGYPGVWLSCPSTPSGHGDDGLLQAWEVASGLKLNCDLIVLAACETGRAKGMRRDTPELPSSLLAAGARAVIAALWNVDDAATEKFMPELHRRLRQGDRIDDGMRAAMRHVRSQNGMAHPKFWAAFNLIGSGDPVRR